VYNYLAVISRGGEVRNVKVGQIAKNTGMSSDFVSKCTNELVRVGLLEKEQKDRNGVIIYRIPFLKNELSDSASKKLGSLEKTDIAKAQIPTKFVANHKLSAVVRIVGVTLLSIAKGRNTLPIDIDFLAKLTGYGNRQISRALAILRHLKYIETMKRKYKSNVFFIKEKLLGGNNGKYYQKRLRKKRSGKNLKDSGKILKKAAPKNKNLADDGFPKGDWIAEMISRQLHASRDPETQERIRQDVLNGR
jgi:DNA-binding IscR family transcriptional regulator